MLKRLLRSEVMVGIWLIIATIAAMIMANSSAYDVYHEFSKASLFFSFNALEFSVGFTIEQLINDGLMTIFFFLIGMELKKEILIGELASRQKVILPLISAVGGVVLPCLIFAAFNFEDKLNMRAFAVPTATDIAFAYGIISLFGRKVSNALKVFLIALAIIDDLIAILFIGFFYTEGIEVVSLMMILIPICCLAVLNLKRSQNITLYMIFGFILWFFVLKSGIHSTIAGVIFAFFIPLEIGGKAILTKLAHKISPPVNIFILPLFAFVNAGVKVQTFSYELFFDPLVLGIICGLFFGKQIGVFLFSYIAVRAKIAHLPKNTSWIQFYGAAIFTGIGFTMSLFIANLAFMGDDPNTILSLDKAKISILLASILSIFYGSLMIFNSCRTTKTI